MSALSVFVSPETGVRKVIGCDREGFVAIWDIATKKKLAEKETDCGNVRSIFYTGRGERFVMVCETGAVLTFNESFQQLDIFHVGCRVLYARPMEPGCVMVATENKELITFNLEAHTEIAKVQITSKEDVRCFDVTADGKYAVVVSNEIQFWNLSSVHREANLCPVLPVRCICLTSDFVSFFMSQDTHIEKWVIDWKISYEGKMYYPPLSQIVTHDTGLEEEEKEEKAKESYKGIETVKEEDEEEDWRVWYKQGNAIERTGGRHRAASP